MNPNKKYPEKEAELLNNPLAHDFKIPVSKFKDGRTFTIVNGEPVPKETTWEKDVVTKVYIDSDKRKYISKLSPSGKSLLLWIQYELHSGKDWIWINKDRYMEENDVKSDATYYAGIKDLCNNVIITPTVHSKYGYYWINPRVLFCGSRINKYPELVIVM